MRSFLLLSSLLFLLFIPLLRAQEEPESDSAEETEANIAARIEYERMRRADPRTGKIPEGIRERELQFASHIPSRESLRGDTKGSAEPLALFADWQQQGPTDQGGRTRALAIDRTNTSTVLAGAVSGGVWRSENFGLTWKLTSDPEQSKNITCIVQDPRPGSGQFWYYGAGEAIGSVSPFQGSGVFRSTNSGRSWFPISSTMADNPNGRDSMFEHVQRIVLNPVSLNRAEIYVACSGGINRSTDGGITWKNVLGSFANHAFNTEIAVTGSGVFYATLSSDGLQTRGIWRSEDGENWTEITPPGFPDFYGRICIGIAPGFEDVVYSFVAGTISDPGSGGHELWYYRYRGSSGSIWENRTAALPAELNTYSSYCQVVRVSPINEDVVFLGGTALYRSTNGFRSPDGTLSMSLDLHPDFHEVLFLPSNPDTMLVAHDGGVSFTDNARGETINWTFRNKGYVTTQFYAVAVNHADSGNDVIIGGTQDNGTWFFNGSQTTPLWRWINGGDGGFCGVADSGDVYYASSQYGMIRQLYLNKDGSQVRASQVGPRGNFQFINPLILDPSNTRVMYLPEGRTIWRANDLIGNPGDWMKMERSTIPTNNLVTSLGVSTRNPSHRLYCGTLDGSIFSTERADTGDPQNERVSAQFALGGPVNSIAVDPYDGDKVLVAVSSYNLLSIYSSTDGGKTWEPVGGNLEEHPDGSGNGPSVGSVAVLPVGDDRVYFAGTTTGLYSTTHLDGMKTRWVQEGASTIGNTIINMIDLRESDGFVAVGTHGRGIFSAHVLASFAPATVRLSSQTIDFGDVPVGQHVSDTLTLTDDAASTRSVRGKVGTPHAPFSIFGGSGDLLLAPGKSRDLLFSFSPDSPRSYTDSILIDHNGTDPQSPLVIYLTGRGVPATGGVEGERELAEVILLRGYPNPFSKSVELRFTLKRKGDVRATILSADGAEVERLFDGKMEGGEQLLTWSPSGVANGTYYVRIQIGSERGTIPIVLER